MTIITQTQLQLVQAEAEKNEKLQEQEKEKKNMEESDKELDKTEQEKMKDTESCQELEEETENTNKSDDEGTPDTPSDTADCPPPMPITISFGTTPGCSGWQIIKKRDPTMTFDEQLAKEYSKMVWDYKCYWYRKSMDVSSSSSTTSDGVSSMPSHESFIDNAPPGLPKGKESASGHPRPKKGRRSSTCTQSSKA